MPVLLTLLAALIATGACAYHRTSLRTWAIATVVTTLVVGLLAHAPWTMAILLIIELAIARAAAAGGFPPPADQRAAAEAVRQGHAETVRDRADRAGGRHGRFRGRAVLRQAGLARTAEAAEARAVRGGTGLHGRPGGRAVRHDRRLADHPRAGRPAAGRVGVHQEEPLLRHDHPEAIRRPAVLRAGAFGGAAEARQHVGHGGLDGGGAELARAGRTAAALRHARSRRTTTCRAWRWARRFRASR